MRVARAAVCAARMIKTEQSVGRSEDGSRALKRGHRGQSQAQIERGKEGANQHDVSARGALVRMEEEREGGGVISCRGSGSGLGVESRFGALKKRQGRRRDTQFRV